VASKRCASPDSREPDAVADLICRLVLEVLDATDSDEVLAVGLGMPGPMRPQDGFSWFSPNLGWRDVPFGRMLRRRFPVEIPIYFDHDVRNAAYAEHEYGAARGASDFAYVTVGTGVGAALMVGGRFLLGPTAGAGEVGHIRAPTAGPVSLKRPCGCGQWGCVEQYASAGTIVREAQSRGLVDAASEGVGIQLGRLASEGDPRVLLLYRDAARALAFGLGVIVNLLDLRHFVVGGGIGSAHPVYWDTLRAETEDATLPARRAALRIDRARLRDDGGVVGAALMARSRSSRLWS
jgi:glucokinase